MNRRPLQWLARRFETAPPGKELALGHYPLLELVPPAEDGFMRYFGINFAAVQRRSDEQTMRMVRKLGNQAPFLIRELRPERTPPHRFTVRSNGRELQREQS